MPHPTRRIRFDDYAERTVQCAVHRLISTYGFPAQDREDLEQHLRLILLEARYDATRAKRTTFIGDCVDHRVANLVRDRLRQCRNPRRLVRMSEGDATSDTEAVGPLPDARAGAATEQSDLRSDIASVIARLTPQQQAICALMGEHAPFVIAKRLRYSKRAVYSDVATIREAFTAAGLAPLRQLAGKWEG